MAQEKRAAAKGGFWSRAKVAEQKPAGTEVKLDYISAKVASLAQLFSGEYRYKLTCFQRAYSWRTQQVTRLLGNVHEAMGLPGKRRHYCLGRLMLAKPSGKPETELVDGHQRIVTLTMVFAVLRDMETDPGRKAWLHGFVAGGSPQGKGKAYRLQAQQTPSLFFETLVQEPGATERILDVEPHELSDVERNIYDNREAIRAELSEPNLTVAGRREFADFLADYCHVIAIVVEDQDQAWELVHIEQETRLDFTAADQAKAILLSTMPPADRVRSSKMWEGCEVNINADDMHRLLVHIGAMKWRCRVQSPVPIETEIVENFHLNDGGLVFMEQEFVPNSERLGAIRRGSVGAEGRHRAAIARSIDYMTWLDLHNWVSAALKWLAVRTEEDPELELFFRRLDRLMWMMKLGGVDPGVQETRIFDLCDEIAKWQKVDSMSRLQIEPKILQTARENLESQNFAAKQYAGVVLRRLSILLGSDSGPITRDKVTMEHVLPRNPPPHSGWRQSFRTEADIKEFSQKVGNITLLTGPQNQKAGTLDWHLKRGVLAESGFALSKRASAETEWTSKVIDRRTGELITLLLRNWELAT